MPKVVIILKDDSNAEFFFTKEFQLSIVPLEGDEVMAQLSAEGGYVSAVAERVTHFLGADIIQVWCRTSLRSLCLLYLGNMDWQPNDKDAFISRPKVKKLIEKILSELSE